MNKVVYNACYGGFGLSEKALRMLAKRKGVDVSGMEFDYSYLRSGSGDSFHVRDFDRHDPDLVAVVEELGSKEASGDCAELVVKEIEGRCYNIDVYDGYEEVETPDTHRWVVIE